MKDLLINLFDRFLPKKSDIGFFQEYDPKIDKIKDSSTRLFQLFMVVFLFMFTKLVFANLFAMKDISLNTLVFVLCFYITTLIATFAPKQFKNIAEIHAFVELLSKQKPEKKE